MDYADNYEDRLQIEVDHELGHIVYHTMMQRAPEKTDAWRHFYWNDTAGSVGRTGCDLLADTSDYATIDDDEGFAECYALYVNGHQDALPEEARVCFDMMGVLCDTPCTCS